MWLRVWWWVVMAGGLVGCGAAGATAFVASNVTLVADWRQTDWMARSEQSPAGYFCKEDNPIMGRRPSSGTVATYFATAIALNSLLYATVPKKWRALVHGAITAFEISILADNHKAGVMAHAAHPGEGCDGIPL